MHEQLRSVLAGDRGAAAWLFDTFADVLFRRLRHRYGYPGGLDADDLVQDTFVLLFQNDQRVLRRFIERFAPGAPEPADFERYLWDLACGVASNRRRSAVRRKVVPLFERERDLVDPSTAEHAAIERDTLRQLEDCLRGRNQRVYLYHCLRYRDGLMPSEIVKVTGWSQKATYKLKQALTEAVRVCAERLGLDG